MGKLKLLACACMLIFGAALTGCNGATDLTDNGSGMTNDNGNGTIQDGDSTANDPEIAEETPDQAGPDIAEETPEQAGPDDFDDGIELGKLCETVPELCDGVQEKKPNLPGENHFEGLEAEQYKS